MTARFIRYSRKFTTVTKLDYTKIFGREFRTMLKTLLLLYLYDKLTIKELREKVTAAFSKRTLPRLQDLLIINGDVVELNEVGKKLTEELLRFISRTVSYIDWSADEILPLAMSALLKKLSPEKRLKLYEKLMEEVMREEEEKVEEVKQEQKP